MYRFKLDSVSISFSNWFEILSVKSTTPLLSGVFYLPLVMSFNEKISDRIREALVKEPKVEEKYMFGGVCYMLNGKMCIGVVKNEMMCRINPEKQEEALSRKGCRPMDFTKKPMKGYIYVSEDGMKSKKDFDYWINLCLEFNSFAKASKKKATKKK